MAIVKQNQDASLYYDYGTMRSHNALFNFILTSRGLGKSFGAKLLIIKDFLKTGEQAVYVRRYVNELNEMKGKFFDDIMASDYYNEYEFTTKGDIAYIREKVEEGEQNLWQPIVHFIPLSTSQKKKSSAYPLVSKIFYDEFIVSSTCSRYLKDEVIVFMELYSTIARLRDNVKAYFLANNVSLVNPYFVFFQNSSKIDNRLVINPNKRFSKSKNGLVLCELYTKEAYKDEFKKTMFGRLIDGTSYGDYAIENETLMDNVAFIIKRPSHNLTFHCSYKLGNEEIGLWLCDKLGIVYVDNKIEPTSNKRYTITNEDFTPDYTSINSLNRNLTTIQTKQSFHNGIMYFKDIQTKSTFLNILKYL